MKIALVTSNYLKINDHTRKGTEILFNLLAKQLAAQAKDHDIEVTAFASGDSELPVPIESITPSAISDLGIPQGKHVLFELALISKALSMEHEFDLFHFMIGNGDIVLPFAPFTKKPLVITINYSLEEGYAKHYFPLFKNLPNVHFVSISNAQRRFLPEINYEETIYNGIDANHFTFNPEGGDTMIWAGRAVPEKGLSTVLEVVRRMKKNTLLFAIPRNDHISWFESIIKDEINRMSEITLFTDADRMDLIRYYQTSRVFLFPLNWEEPFGLVLTESMACGTPVVAYARGSLPEIVKDGETGFLVNTSDEDLRGDWIVKKTGFEGMCEAVERIYSMSKDEYRNMRRACRTRVEEHFTADRMANRYMGVYKRLGRM